MGKNRMFIKYFLIFITMFAIFSGMVLALQRMLTFQNQIDSKVMVLEGWISEVALNEAYTLFVNEGYEYILTTGHQLNQDVTLYVNSFFIVHLLIELADDNLIKLHTIKIDAESTFGKNDSAHFVLWVNDKETADFYTTDSRDGFTLSWEGKLNEIDSVMVEFDNDKVSQYGDRNLRINSISINKHDIIRKSPARFIDRGRPFGQSRWNIAADTYAALAANYFIGRGIDSNRVISVPNYSNQRRTYGNALALRDWFSANNFNAESINIVSTHYHSRRTWMTYNSLLKDRMEVGIISLDVAHTQRKTHTGRFKTIARESIALLYYIFFILPWI